METVSINTENSRTNESTKFSILLLTNLILKTVVKITCWLILTIKSAYSNSKFKISAPMWNHEFSLPDGSYSVSNIHDYSEYIKKKHKTIAYNPPIKTFIRKIKRYVVFKIKTSYNLVLLSEETMRLLGSTEKVVAKEKNSENVPKLEIVDVILMHCSVLNNNY